MARDSLLRVHFSLGKIILSSKEANRAEEVRGDEREVDFQRAEIARLQERISSGEYTSSDVEKLGEFLERARGRDSKMKYYAKADKAYRNTARELGLNG